MIHVSVGTDVYGAVRSVNRTPIVTKFAMFQAFPLYPLQSFYLQQLGKTTHAGVPLVAGISERTLSGIPCDRVNRLSVFVAYVRAVGATVIIVACIGIFIFGVGSLCEGGGRGKDSLIAFLILGGVLAAGLLIALPTYVFTFRVPIRDRRIREACARFLRLAADPAHVHPAVAKEIAAEAETIIKRRSIPAIDVILARPKEHHSDELAVWLVIVRAEIHTADQPDMYESLTDRILDAIDVMAEKEDTPGAL